MQMIYSFTGQGQIDSYLEDIQILKRIDRYSRGQIDRKKCIHRYARGKIDSQAKDRQIDTQEDRYIKKNYRYICKSKDRYVRVKIDVKEKRKICKSKERYVRVKKDM